MNFMLMLVRFVFCIRPGRRETALLLFLISGMFFCAQAIDVRSKNPYYSAVVMNADSGEILWEDHAGAAAYPASMIKMMNCFVVLDDVAAGNIRLDDPVKINREAERMGGRQVWLQVGEVFTVSELMDAMMIHSANDAATALAIHSSGTKDAHAARMTAKARALGLRHAEFHNVHGLPPGPGQSPDIASALDMAELARALIREHPVVLEWSSVPSRDFRKGKPVRLTSSNALLGRVEGCDGLKTGYYRAGGFSITATAQRNGVRIIAVVMGCRNKETRNQWAERLLERGFERSAE
jgi:serine-type D-Ala-D-Ala carboxypeptidase (penicillin-binding protein 5/6)